MYKKITMLLLLCCCIATSASAHVMNRDNVYSDLTFTEAADDVVLLAALHVIQSDYKQFEPAAPLTMAQLAQWVAGYYGLPDAEAAVEAGFVPTLQGEATYEAVNAAYFNGALVLQAEQTGVLTREMFAQFVATQVNNAVNGQTMIEAAGFKPGPTGVIEAFNVIDGDNVLIIEGKAYALGKHPSAIASSADPSVWVGETIAESYIGPNSESDYSKSSDHTALQFVVLGQERYTTAAAEETALQHVTVEQALQEVDVLEKTINEAPQKTSSNIWILSSAGLFLFVMTGLMWKKKRT